MKPSNLIFIFILLIEGASLQTQAQKQGQALIDSLLIELPKAKEDTNKVDILNSLGREILNSSDKARARQYIDEAITISQKINYKKGEAKAYNIIGIDYMNQGNYPDALKYYDAALKINNEMGDKIGIASGYSNIGIIYSHQGKYPEALKNHLACLKLREEAGNKKGMGNTYNNIGNIYSQQGSYPEALKNYFAGLKIFEEIGDKHSMARTYINIGGIYLKKGNNSEALKNYLPALKILENLGNKHSMVAAYNNIALIYRNQGNYQEAMKIILSAIKINEEIGDAEGMIYSYLGLAGVNNKLNNYAEAKKNLNTALSLSAKIGSNELLKESYHGLSLLDSTTSNWKDAYLNYKLYTSYYDSLVNEENTQKTVETQMQYEFDKKESATKAEQDKKDVITQAEIKKQKVIRNSISTGLAIVFLFSLVVYRQRNRISKEKKRSDELLLNILPAETAEELKKTGTTKAKDFSDVTVLFTDFKNFTAMSEKLSAQELVNEIDYCYSAFDNIITKHGIEKIKTIGDSYMCAGGLPVANTTNAEDTVRAALEIRNFMLDEKQKREAQDKPFFEIRIGCNTGSVVAGIVGIKKYSYDIWGDTVNIASRMESSGEAGKVNISGSTYELVKDKFKCEHRGKIQAKNKGEIDMYFVEKA